MATTTSTALSNRNRLLGFGLATLAAIGFSGKAILVKLAYYQPIDAVTLLALRMLFSAPFFLIVAWRHVGRKDLTPLTGRDYLALLILGLLGYYLSSLFDFIGLQYISAGLERLILFLYPTMVVVLSAVVLGKPFGRKEIVALLLSYAGIGVVFFDEITIQSAHLLLGAGFVFASTLTYAAYLIGTGETVVRIGASRFTAYAMLVACLATVLQFLFTHPPQALLLPMRVYQLSLLMAIFSTVLPVFMLSAAIKMIGSSHTSLIGSLGPVATLFMASYFLGEELSLAQIGGATLVMVGVLSLSLK
ncbi:MULTISPECIES: DMT family transporter [Methylomonas]|uniref:Multidrug DMT transporter permease n=2 Tax=Methylomonas TaxID=416 RepID=A0A140E408_9GAMM|nr:MULTISPECIES: DMT family transporter [Methylomonas]AMK75132.1 multidrug DMT transporter permease [Methylomonas denitrificans]OAI02621.1 multidrug DMT transporter permease [Methylomonas methanica]TCV83053.1 threonine/homoserine efflux transporter RhtA [Methylomonas methanica]